MLLYSQSPDRVSHIVGALPMIAEQIAKSQTVDRASSLQRACLALTGTRRRKPRVTLVVSGRARLRFVFFHGHTDNISAQQLPPRALLCRWPCRPWDPRAHGGLSHTVRGLSEVMLVKHGEHPTLFSITNIFKNISQGTEKERHKVLKVLLAQVVSLIL